MESRITFNIKVGDRLLASLETKINKAPESLMPEWFLGETSVFPIYASIETPQEMELINAEARTY